MCQGEILLYIVFKVDMIRVYIKEYNLSRTSSHTIDPQFDEYDLINSLPALPNHRHAPSMPPCSRHLHTDQTPRGSSLWLDVHILSYVVLGRAGWMVGASGANVKVAAFSSTARYPQWDSGPSLLSLLGYYIR